MSCPKMEKCPLYPHFRSTALLAIWKTRYCEADASRYESCARFKLAMQGGPVPELLLPNGELLPTPDDEPAET